MKYYSLVDTRCRNQATLHQCTVQGVYSSCITRQLGIACCESFIFGETIEKLVVIFAIHIESNKLVRNFLL